MATLINDLLHGPYRYLFLDFLAELMNKTHTAAPSDAFQLAVQAYCDGLRPWMLPSDIPIHCTSFSLFAYYQANNSANVFTV